MYLYTHTYEHNVGVDTITEKHTNYIDCVYVLIDPVHKMVLKPLSSVMAQ